MADNYNILLDKLDAFIRKYYKNRMIRGMMYSVGLVVGFFLLIAVMEYFGRFDTTGRTILFWGFALSSVFIIGRFIIQPLIKIYRLGKVISYEQASVIVGTHFPEVKDKLLNTLQLKQLSSTHGAGMSLVEASIDQRASELRPVPFSSAIDLGENTRYLKFALPPLLIFLFLLFTDAKILKDSTNRLVNHGTEFVEEAPFQFNIVNDKLEVPRQEDFLLELEIDGELVPDKVFLKVDGATYKMDKRNSRTFSHMFKNIQSSTDFKFAADKFYSKEYNLKVLPKPVLLGFQVSLIPPAYTGEPTQTLRNVGNLSVPAGTKARWQFNTENTDVLSIYYKDSVYTPDPEQKDLYFFNDRLWRNGEYAVSTRNSFMSNKDSIIYSINVVPDLYPEISVEQQSDTADDRRVYFRGEIKDDYGFSRLTFNYTYLQSASDSIIAGRVQSEEVNFSAGQSADQFFHYWDMTALGIAAGEEIEYYFEIWDNDGVNGAKSTRSKTQSFKAPSKDELAAEQEKSNEEIKDELEKAIKESQELQKEVEEVKREVMDKKELNWQDKKKIEKLLEKQKNLENRMDNIQQQNENKLEKQERYQKQENENLLDKQKQLQELFEQVMSPEMKELYRQMEEMMKELDQEKIQEQLEQMEMTNEEIEEELDRNLELFKQLEVEMKAEEIKEKLDELAEKQKELAEKTEKGEESTEDLKKEQEELKEEFEQVKDDIDALEKLNEELEEPNDMDTESMEEDVDDAQDDSSNELDKGNESKAAESQKEAGEKMEQMSAMMANMAGGGGEEEQEEDMDALRALLENIIDLSFDQEGVMDQMKGISKDDPKYVDHGQFQRKLKDDAQIIKDSLLALSKRVMQIAPKVNKEISSINSNMSKAIDAFSDRQTPEVLSKQQYVMTSLNELALLLDDALQQMQKEMASMMQGTGNCSKPGGKGQGKPGKNGKPKSMSQMQKAMQEKLKGLQKGMSPGQSGMPGRSGMSEKLAKTAAEQGALRRALEEKAKELNEDGSGNGNQLKKIAKDMEEVERDIVNNDVTRETINRQQEILTRLLQHEKAEKEREYDNKRKSNEAIEYQISNPDKYFEHNQMKQKEIELLRTVPPDLRPYYKNKVNEYFIKFDQQTR
jgi:hypothetical protein